MSGQVEINEELLRKVRRALDKAADRARTADVYELEELVDEVDKLLSTPKSSTPHTPTGE